MKNIRIDIEQGTQEWDALRAKKIGASEVACVLGISPYKSPYGLFMEKKGRIESTWNSNMRYGHEKELELREQFCQENGENFMPAVYQNPKHEFLLASLDGINFDETAILEIKTCNREVYEKALKGEIVPHYYAQIQAQLQAVPTAKKAYYLCYFPGRKTETDGWTGNGKVLVEVERNDNWWSEHFPKLEQFYLDFNLDIAPSPEEKDPIIIDDEPEMEVAIERWKTVKEELDEVKKQVKKLDELEKEAREQVTQFTDDGNCIAYGVEISRRSRSSVDYKRACIENEIDLSKYEKPQIGYWNFKLL